MKNTIRKVKMKRFSKQIVMTLCLVICLSTVFVIAACGVTKYDVTFDLNYTGAGDPTVVSVEEGDTVDEPTAPTRTNHYFSGWYTDKSASEDKVYDFGTAIKTDVTLFAGWEIYPAVTFDLNYTGAPAATVVYVEKGKTATAPANPTGPAGHTLNGWYTDKSGTFAYDFGAVNENITVYAQWLDSSATYIDVTFDYNYKGSPESAVQKVTSGGNAIKPANPTRTDGEFLMWCTDPEGNNEYSFNTAVSSAITLYAKWNTVYTFEAEYINVRTLYGYGYYSGFEGPEMVMEDKYDAGASNGFFLGGLYNHKQGDGRGDIPVLEFTSDRAISNAKLVFRLSVEYEDFTLTPEMFEISVNGGDPIQYDQYEFTGAVAYGGSGLRPFNDIVIGNIDLLKGANTIQFKTVRLQEGEHALIGGTMYAYAPLVDCIKITTTAVLDYDPYVENIEIYL